MEQQLSAITSDCRLDRIFGAHDKSCAIQLWLLQLKWNSKMETRVLYGRVAPSSYCNNQWNAPREDAFKCIDDGLEAQVIRLNLFCGSKLMKDLLESLAGGSSLEEVSNPLHLKLSKEIADRFGGARLATPFGFRPAMHLPARDYFRWTTNRLSPTSSASADSAAITSLAKSELFVVGNQTEPALAVFAIDELSGDTGMDFSQQDAWRLGDIELLVLPGLDDDERQLVNIKGNRSALEVEIIAPLAPPSFELQIRALFLNDNSVFHADTVVVPLGSVFPLTVTLSVPPFGRDMLDAYELEIDAKDVTLGVWRTCVRWGVYLVREIHQQMHFSGGVTSVKNDWLSTALRPGHKSRLDGVQQIARQTRASASMIGGRQSDPWVPANRQASSVVAQLVPRKSDGRFFLRYSEGENTGRLELAEWLKKLFADNRDKHIAWFDPYMEDVGINLLNQYGSDVGNYLIFTGVPKDSPVMDWSDHLYYWSQQQDMPEQQEQELRIPKLKAACKAWADKVGSVRLRVIGLSGGDLHDRMILIRNAHMEPVAGYHLSNSIQRANENYPLLITPIPADVLQRVVAYADTTIKNALENVNASGTAPQVNSILFDSDAHVRVVAPIYSQDDIYKMPRAGEVIAWWLGDPAFLGLSEEKLKDQLDTHGLLLDGGLRGPVFDAPPHILWSHGLNVPNFNSAWDAMGILLASTMAGDNLRQESPTLNTALSQALYAYLDSGRKDALQPPPARYGLINMTEQLQKALPELLKQVSDPDRMFPHDVTEVSWGDHYAIKVLWFTDPTTLVRWIEEGASEQFRSNQRRQLGLKCAVRVICFEIAWRCSKPQLDALLASTNDFLRWMGFVAFEALLQGDPRAIAEVHSIPRLGAKEKVQLLGWLIARSNHRKTPMRDALISELMATLPSTLSAEELVATLDSMRSTSRRIYDTPPWILQDIVAPLIQLDRVNLNLAAEAWLKEIVEVWDDGKSNGGLLFRADSEGAFTDEVVNLFSLAGGPTQERLLACLKRELATCGRAIRLPFSTQIDWSTHDRALVISLWIAAILDAVLKCLPRPGRMEPKVRELLAEANNLVSRRLDHDWRRTGINDLVRYRAEK